MKLKVLLSFAILTLSVFAYGQKRTFWVAGDVPLERSFTLEIERSFGKDSLPFHTSIKPFTTQSPVAQNAYLMARDTTKYYTTGWRKLLRDHLVEARDEDFVVSVDPLFNFSYGQDINDFTGYADTVRLINNTRGMLLQGRIGKQVWFQTGFYENQTYAPLFIKAFADSTGVMPGAGRTKKYKVTGFDYNMSFGSVSYQPWSFLVLQIGYGKHFIGNGYRSLLLSDASFSYPYLKATATWWKDKLQYTAIATTLQNMERLPLGEVPESLFKRKGGSFYYLSFQPTQAIEVGIFEGTIRQRVDSANVVPLTWDTYVPILGVSSLINGLNGTNNVLTGVNARVQLSKHAFLYGQLACDNLKNARVGWQVGAQFLDLGVKNLDITAESNTTTDYMYSDARGDQQSYSHFNQPLGLMAGAGVQEYIGIVHYRYRRWDSQVKFNYYTQSGGPEGTWWNDPTEVIQPLIAWAPRQVQQWDVATSLCLNPKTNMRLTLGVIDRIDRTAAHTHTSYVYLGFRTNLHSFYTDF